jgi:hypothetical protein
MEAEIVPIKQALAINLSFPWIGALASACSDEMTDPEYAARVPSPLAGKVRVV